MDYQSWCSVDDNFGYGMCCGNRVEHGEMIQYFIEMPIEKQTWTVLSIGWLMLAASAAIREKTPPGELRNWARAMGVFGAALMSLQLIHTTLIAEELNTELMVKKRRQDATQIAKVESVALVTKRGTVVEIGDIHGVRTVSGIDRNRSASDRGNRFRDLAVNERESSETRNNLWLLDAISNVHEWAGAATFRAAEDFRSDAEQF